MSAQECPKDGEESLSKEVIDEVKEESTSLIKELFDNVFGDFRKFLSVLTTTGYWFVLPLSINSREHQDPKSRFMNDLQLVKTLFFLIILFLVLDTTLESEDAEIEKWAAQVTYFLFYCLFLGVFVVIGKTWCTLAKPKIDDQREFSAHLLYQCSTLIFIQVLVYVLLEVRVTEKDSGDFITHGVFLALGLPYAHTLYFFFKLNQRYSPERKIIGTIFIVIVMTTFLLSAGAINELFLSDGFAETVE